MLHKTIMTIGLAAALAVLAAPAMSQQDVKQVSASGFAKTTRPPVAFDHEGHNAKAKLDDCGVCHHGGTNGKLDPKATSEGQPCADCHPAKAQKGITPLMRAYHRQCGGCHERSGKGPIACGECHKNAPASPAKAG